MPRDAADTREALLRAAERLFAEQGVSRTTTREIVRAAGQGNASAVSYHFGSREDLLLAILTRHDAAVDDERGRLLDAAGEAAGTRELVAVLLAPYAATLADQPGRDFLRIVAQLTDAFPAWRSAEYEGPHLRRVLSILEDRPQGLPAAVRRARVVALIALLTSTLADRAARVEHGRDPALDEPTFLANLADMLVGILDAPAGPPLTA